MTPFPENDFGLMTGRVEPIFFLRVCLESQPDREVHFDQVLNRSHI